MTTSTNTTHFRNTTQVADVSNFQHAPQVRIVRSSVLQETKRLDAPYLMAHDTHRVAITKLTDSLSRCELLRLAQELPLCHSAFSVVRRGSLPVPARLDRLENLPHSALALYVILASREELLAQSEAELRAMQAKVDTQKRAVREVQRLVKPSS